MFYNDIHILYYVLFGAIGAILGQAIDYCSRAFLKEKKILSKSTVKVYKKTASPNYILIVAMIVSYVALLYTQGLNSGIENNIDLIKYMLLIPMLFCAFHVDLKEQIIPNRLNLTMFQIGLIFVFIKGLANINISVNLLLGMLAGGGIFLSITLIGGLIAGREAMGLRRCKNDGSTPDYSSD